ncbi:MAG: hypothetical protein ACI9S8_000807 [Chlamydiales bacterium]|jgi:hypothetical protein
MSSHYWVYGESTIEDARKLSICILEGLIEKVNNDPKLHPFLLSHPFSHDKFGLLLSYDIIDKDGFYKHPPYPKLGIVIMANGKFFYDTFNPDGPKQAKFETLHEETYEEALEIVLGKTTCDTETKLKKGP